ncbi:hypothetical protein SAMN05216327_11872 [Dyadobacter sp. SG02]|nr:hypothetical protein SAMN05216327_11872 [Dyadobacter sp. SG02]
MNSFKALLSVKVAVLHYASRVHKNDRKIEHLQTGSALIQQQGKREIDYVTLYECIPP